MRRVLVRDDRRSALLLVCAVAAAVFAGLVQQVLSDGVLLRLDDRVSRWSNGLVGNHERLVDGLVAMTSLGGSPARWLMVAGLIAFTSYRSQHRLSLFILATATSGVAANNAIKALVDRDRPVLDAPIVDASGASFPSGHAMGSTIVVGLIVIVLRPHLPRRVRRGAVIAAAVVVALIGASRVLLGAHFLTDVVAGHVMGIGWLAAAIAALSVAGTPGSSPHRAADPAGRPTDGTTPTTRTLRQRGIAATRRSLERGDLYVAAAVLAAAVAILALGLRGGDHPAHVFRLEFLERYGFEVWNNNWYGGHHIVSYGMLFSVLAAGTSMAAIALASTVAPVVLFGSILRRAEVAYPRTATAAFGFLMIVNLYVGRLPFALGITLALLAVRLALARRWGLAACAGVAVALASPLASAFLAFALMAWAASGDVHPAAVWRHPGTRLALVVATPVALLAALYPEGGRFPYRVDELVFGIACATAACLWLPRSERVLRLAFGGASLVALVLFVVPNPLGANWTRFAVLGAPLLLAVPRTGLRIPLLAGIAMTLWQAIPLLSLPATVADPSASRGFHRPLVDAIRTHADGPVRVEIPFTAGHWEAAFVAREVPLARGWQRQLDRKFNAQLYDDDLTHETYRAWLLDHGVSFVAVPDVALEEASERQAALIESAGYLRLVWTNDDWDLYRLDDTPGVVTGPARLIEFAGNRVRLVVERPGDILLRVRHSPYLRVDEGDACISRSDAGWTVVTASRTGPLAIDTGVAGRGVDACNEPSLECRSVTTRPPRRQLVPEAGGGGGGERMSSRTSAKTGGEGGR